MMESYQQNFKKRNSSKEDFTLIDIFGMVFKRKSLLFISLIIFLLIAFIYNEYSSKVYEATTIIKKEKSYKERNNDQLNDIIFIQNRDEIETEIELLKSRKVLERVVKELRTYFIIKKIEFSNQKKVKINKFLYNYLNEPITNLPKKQAPEFKNIKTTIQVNSNEYYILKEGKELYHLYEANTDSLILSSQFNKNIIRSIKDHSHFIKFKLPNISFEFDWRNAKKGDKVYFKIKSIIGAVENLRQKLSVDKVRNTNLFELSVKSGSPKSAKILSDKIVEQYRESRLSQKKRSIKKSYDFIDEQLKSVEKKLKQAETELSRFKSKHHLVSVGESSKDIIEFLSSLESEKVQTDLELTEYTNKLNSMERELGQKEYFDQTYLTPNNQRDRNPFSVLLEQLSDAELERLELLQKRTENHPDVIAVDERIAQIKEKLSNYNQNTLFAYKTIISSLQDKKENLETLIRDYSKKIENLPGQETKLVELTRKKSVYEKIFTLLLDKREEMRMAELSQLQDIVVVDEAHVPVKPIQPKKKFNLLIAIALGALFGLVSIFIREFQSVKITDINDIDSIYRFPILSVIPQYDRGIRNSLDQGSGLDENLVILGENNYSFREAYRQLRTKLDNLYPLTSKTMLFTSCEESSGKTTATANFATSLGEMGKKVLIIDCDLRKSQLSTFFNIKKSSFGLSDFLRKDTKLTLLHPFELTKYSHLKVDLIPAGRYSENSSELLGSNKMKMLIEKAEQKYDHILIDTPPLTQIVDTFVLGKFIRNVVLLIRPNSTVGQNIDWAIEEFDQSSMNLLGFVINACDIKKSSYRYKYRYQYGYKEKNKN